MDALARSFPAAHPVFAGHFPNHPIVPGVMLLDWVQTAIEASLGQAVTGLLEAKFLSPATPNERLELALESTVTAIRFEVRCGERKVASGRFAVPVAAP